VVFLMNVALICYECADVTWQKERFESMAAYFKLKDPVVPGMSTTFRRRYWTCGECWCLWRVQSVVTSPTL